MKVISFKTLIQRNFTLILIIFALLYLNMRKKLIFIPLIVLLATVSLKAQLRHTVSGTIIDMTTGETIIGAMVYVRNTQNTYQAISNEYGFYSLTLPDGKHNVIFSMLGYSADTLQIRLTESMRINHSLRPDSYKLAEVVVSAGKKNDNVRRTDIGVQRVDVMATSKIPVLFGEKDIMKTIQLFPGVKSAGEGNSGFYVRGGSADQNLILLDEAGVYNASHLLGFFSTFNSDAIKDVSIIKGNIPAQYGGRLSSVLDVKMKEGNNQDFSASGGLGLISSRLSVEGPLINNKSSFIVSARRSYADVFLGLTDKYKNNTLYFYDLNAKLNFKINDKNRVFVSGYLGRDMLGLNDEYTIDWGNISGTLRWNSIISPKIFSNTSLIYSNYDYKVMLESGNTVFNIISNIEDLNFKEEIQLFPDSKSIVKIGINSIYHAITPSRFEGSGFNAPVRESRYSLENAAYINGSFKLGKSLTMDIGARFSAYTILGGDTYNIFEEGLLTDSIKLSKGDIGKTYMFLEPRMQFSIMLGDRSSIKGGYARNTQNMHLLSNAMSSSPIDQWVGNSYNVKPEISDQVSLGYFLNMRDCKYEFSVETYYKYMQNQVDFRDGADLYTIPDIESELRYGIGRAYGVELLLQKMTGKFSGWIGYTLSRVERKIDSINKNEWYVAKQDKTHDLTLVANWQITPSWVISGLFVYNTGNAVTFPSGKYIIDGKTVYYYTERNGYRMPAYHRADICATYFKKRRGKFESSWNFSLYNLYGRENAYLIEFETDPDDDTRTRAVKTSLFRWVPSITYNFKF